MFMFMFFAHMNNSFSSSFFFFFLNFKCECFKLCAWGGEKNKWERLIT